MSWGEPASCHALAVALTKGVPGVLATIWSYQVFGGAAESKPSICAWLPVQRQASGLVGVTSSVETESAIQAGVLSSV